MTKIRQICGSVVLTLALSICAFAGDISTMSPGQITTMSPGDMHTMNPSPLAPGDGHNPGAPSDSVMEVALSLLQSLLSVF